MSWYKDGLPFKCTSCGKCCTGAPGYVWVNEDEVKAISQFLNMSSVTFVRQIGYRVSLREKENYDCIFLKDNKCTIYEVRPKQCRTFPWWQENLKNMDAWKKTAEICEGINDSAPIHTYEQIIALF